MGPPPTPKAGRAGGSSSCKTAIQPKKRHNDLRSSKGVLFLMLFLGLAYMGQAEKAKGLAGSKPDTKKKEPGSGFTIRVPVDVVVVNALVTDKKGDPVKDLKVDDFKVYEDGKLQPIHTFTLETYRPVQEPAGAAPGKDAQAPSSPAEPAATPRYFSLVIDDLNSPAMDQFFRTIEAMKKFVINQILPGDLVMVYAVSGRAEFPFTSDKAALVQYLSELYKKLNLTRTNKIGCPQMTDLQAYYIATDRGDPDSLSVAVAEYCSCNDCTNLSREAIEQSVKGDARSQYYEDLHYRQVALSSLRQHVRSLRHFEGRKSVILFSSGFIAEDVRFEIQEVVDRSLRSGVVFNSIDARGLYTAGFAAADRINLSMNNAALLGRKTSLLQSSQSAQADPLSQFATETGGLFFHNNNDLYAGLKAVADRQTYYYVLTYASPNNKSDGRYHKIKLEISRPGVEVNYRKGYYAPKEEISFESRKKEDILEAMRAPGDINKIPIQVSFNYYQIDDSHYQLSVLTRVDVRDIKFLSEDTRHRNVMNLVLATFDEKDHYVDGLEKSIEFNLSDPSFANLVNYGLTSKVEMAVPPGRYKIKSVVREGAQTKMGSVTKWIEVP